jgi:hypothetical protein
VELLEEVKMVLEPKKTSILLSKCKLAPNLDSQKMKAL